MDNSSDKLLKPKISKTHRKKLASMKRLRRKQNKSLQSVYNKIRKSEGADSIHDLTDGETVLFIEDKRGDDSVDSPRPTTDSKVMREANSNESNKDRRRSHKQVNVFSPQRKKSKMAPQCSTPISKNVSLDVSNLSEVVNVKSPQSNKSIERQIRKLQKELDPSFVTIDLTNGSETKNVIDLTNSQDLTDVIDVERSEGECSITLNDTTVSDVTVIERQTDKLNEREIAHGIAQLNSSEKGRLLEMITKKIFNGCQVTPKKCRQPSRQESSAEDTYIREMISGDTRDSVGGNVYHPGGRRPRSGLRMVVIDGSNVAMQHGRNGVFSVHGLKICIDYFLKRGHTVKAFVPQYRCHAGKSSEPHLLSFLERRGLVVFTPSRRLDGGRCYSSYDDRFIVQCAAEFDGVIVSQDRYRDLVAEKPSWAETVECRLLQYTWVEDMIMFPVDPLGKDGPDLDTFLRHA